jgi:hypothetical protein
MELLGDGGEIPEVPKIHDAGKLSQED